MTDNLSIWNALGKTDPAHTKPFNRAGGFKGTAVKPMWVMQRLTEEFGPCGVGWGIGEPSFQVVPAGNEVLVYCTVACWHGDTRHVLHGVGGDKVQGVNKYGPYTDDEAFKKAFTDAVMNAFKFVGVAADVHMGRFDDNKYVAEVRQEFNGETPRPAPANGLGTEKRDTGPGSVDGKDWWGCSGPGLSPAAAKRDAEMQANFDAAKQALENVLTPAEWKSVCAEFNAKIATMPKVWRTLLRADAERIGADVGVDFNERRAA